MFTRKATISLTRPTTVLNYLVPKQPATDQSPHAKSQAVLALISPLPLPVFLKQTRLLQPPPAVPWPLRDSPAVSHKLLVWVGGSTAPFLTVHFKLSSPERSFRFPGVHVKREHAVFAVRTCFVSLCHDLCVLYAHRMTEFLFSSGLTSIPLV